jgi:hypothetical protein
MVLLATERAPGYPWPVTSYAVTARIQAPSPRIRDHARRVEPMPATVTDDRIVLVETTPVPRRILARLDDLSRALGEKTFYLFDAEGWR